MTEEQAVEAISKRWRDAWDALMPLDDIGVVPYTFEGEVGSAFDYWARVKIIHNGERQMTTGAVGTRRVERFGRVFVQLFAPIHQGAKQITKMSDAVRSVLALQRLVVVGDDEPVITREAVPGDVESDGRWVRTVMNVPFVYIVTA